ncbi:MAG: [FeFe] hydrogenase H-cluster radical SAM maturase HydE, partial [Bacteroidales bacterium]|nr:[FeFe] hydrogenase H-cluster radical SAM maturase HydE [Bacteroidales bacterium]
MNLSELTLDREGLAAAIACEDAAFEAALREEAYRVKVANVGPEVYLRGLIEISNKCAKNCLYCGIRRDIRCQRYEL